jgi:hypothetical protein
MRITTFRAAAIAVAGFVFTQLHFVGVASTEEVTPSPPHVSPEPDKPSTHWPQRGYAELRPTLDEDDEIAVLEAIRVALTEVGDGSTYVWHRRHGRLSGMVQPTSSYKDRTGRVCRHIRLIMNAGTHTGRVEGVACRLNNGRWQLDG